MPDHIPAEAAPPSVEHLIHEIRAWSTTLVGGQIIATGIPAALADSMARYCAGVGERALGEVFLRLSSHLASHAADDPDMPPWMFVNLIGAAGVNLIEKSDDHV